jgi:secondary thiamine-phosphate synthase enzyme
VIIATTTLSIATAGRELQDITARVRELVTSSGVKNGLCALFLKHTSASLVIQENADPAVLRDLERWMSRLAPESGDAYEHDAEGRDDMPAHLRTAVTRSSETIPIVDAALGLGTWQAIYLWEHRRAPHRRDLTVSILGE